MRTDRTFCDFFQDTFINEHHFAGFRPHHFKTFYEMARRHDVAKMPVNFDEDDIQFLQQFPHAFWAKASQQRYNLLFDAVEKLHHERRGMGHEALAKAIATAMTTQNWSPLKRLMPDDLVSHMARHFRPALVREMNPRQIDIEADKLAHEYLKSKTDRVEDPGEVEFTFQANDFDVSQGKDTSSERTSKKVTFVARPYLNRLYHKLERTKGLPHTPDSGLGGEGQYGYDLAEPKRSPNPESPHATAGMKFPTPEQTRNRIRDFLNLNQHRMFGDLPKDAEWLPTKYTDRWSLQYVQDKLRKQIEARLRVSGQYEDNKTLERDARAMAKKQVIDLAKAGKLKGPPIPGKFPNGIPIEVVGPEGRERLVAPPLYLPHQLKDVTIKQPDGTVKSVKREIPLVNPAHFFRELGSHDEDYQYEKGRKKYGPDGRPIFGVPQDKLRGHEQQFVHVADDEFIPTKHRQAGALDFNHNTEGRRHLTRGDEGYDTAFEKVFGTQRKVLLDAKNRLVPTTGAGFYEDIMRGILACINSAACGGATSHERAILLQNIEDVHQIIVQAMLADLGNEKLYDRQGRLNYAKSKAANYIQKNQGKGGGTRRLRKLTQTGRDLSLDATTTGKEGGQISIADKLMAQIKDKEKLGGESGRRVDTSDRQKPVSAAVANTKQPDAGVPRPVVKDDTKARMKAILAKRRAGGTTPRAEPVPSVPTDKWTQPQKVVA
jgi:hypothetical protein